MMLRCSKCGKKLIERKSNGTLIFKFGKSYARKEPPVEIEIIGNARMRCIRDSCRKEHPDHWNVFTLLPQSIDQVEQNSGKTHKSE